MPRARTELIRKFGVGVEIIEVASLKVVRLSKSGKSLLCEVHEYCPEEEAGPISSDEVLRAEEGNLIPTVEESVAAELAHHAVTGE